MTETTQPTKDLVFHFRKGVPMPNKNTLTNGRKSKYPFDKIEVDTAAFIPDTSSKELGGLVNSAAKRLGCKFNMRSLSAEQAQELFQINEAGIGIWRAQV